MQVGFVLILVEMVGVEPTSESISAEFSPSAADHLLFRIRARRSAGWHIRYPIVPLSY